MNVLDLFSGIGGFSLGLERAGMKTVAFCEIDQYCRKILNKHWPEVPIYEDIRTLNAERLQKDGIPTIDVICGGFPCQPFSVAGKQKGKDDNRYLWPEMLRVIAETKPTYIIGENVAGIVNMALEQVSVDLENQGYEVQTLIIPACAANAPHRRDRVWILGYAEHHGQFTAENGRKQPQSQITTGTNQKREFARTGGLSGDVADTNSAGRKEFNASPLTNREGYSRGGIVEARSYWEAEPSVGRVVDGLSGRVDRIKALGNAVVPQIPEIIGRAIMEVVV